MSGHVKRNGPVAFQLRFGLALAARPCQTRLRSPVWQPSAPHCPSTPRLGCRDSQPRTQLGPAPGLVHARISAGGRVVCRGDRDSRALGHRVLDRMPPLAGWPFFPPKRSKKGICSRRRDRLVAHDAALRRFIRFTVLVFRHYLQSSSKSCQVSWGVGRGGSAGLRPWGPPTPLAGAPLGWLQTPPLRVV